MASIDDLDARANNYISTDADWIDFEATVSTAADQIAVAPGSLRREWTENDRRFFHYKSDGPILCFYSFLSARYEVLQDLVTFTRISSIASMSSSSVCSISGNGSIFFIIISGNHS